ncbi:HlyD family type I secretion periplasmic adaptor subunit [Leptolyngbya sp. NIES-2104]|uniref:HlyD family type I secretion periplasmic adaptor subunit n=1 Tax=Leptolyngbya sp. NIES-2104 TaxID=1552121 RepID=UPI0006ECABB0|nr:HlyD family type I secretion periplasmic adaptor subunit [Leptolyngbya sp. NIES-2104]GAP95529.1 HlyD family secretion protein [Leptolyngbya sp. NIES-2104]
MKNPRFFASLQSRYQTLQDQFENTLESKATGLPAPANWTKRLTQIILLGVAAGAGWSVLARVDVVVNASGKLEPQSQSQVVQSRSGGVVTGVLVREGESVKQGQLLMQFDRTSLLNRLQELLIQRQRLVKETAVLRLAQQGKSIASVSNSQTTISPELMSQVQTRLLLIAQLSGDAGNLAPEQQQRFNLYQQQLRDRQSLTSLQASTLQSKMAEADAQIRQTEFQLQREQELLDRLRPLVEQGAIPRVSMVQREVAIGDLQKQLVQSTLQRQQVEIGQVQGQVEAGKSLNETQQDLQKQLAELDTKFDSIIKDNQRQLVEVISQLNQVQLDLKNQGLRSPADGVIFELATKLPGAVTQPGQTLLQVVPNEALIARVQVANADIANVQVGLPVDVRIDAYPFTEFGAIKGVVSKVGSEAVPTSQQTPRSTAFPIEVRLDRQFLERRSERFTLKPGMTITAMVKVRQRAPISYVTEEITKAFDGMKSVR